MSTNFSVNGTSFDNYYISQAYLNQFVITGSLWGWGENFSGLLGTNNVIYRSSPVQTAAGGTNWLNAVSGQRHAASVKTDGTLWTWGINNYGQLGSGTTINRSSPNQVTSGGTNWRTVACGQDNTAAVKQNGQLWTWGRNNYGQLAIYTNGYSRSSPVQTIIGGTNWAIVTTGVDSLGAIKTNNSLWTWGRNNHGQLGIGNTVNQQIPVDIAAGGWSEVVTCNTQTIALKTDGTLWGWGRNARGQLGTNNTISVDSPVQTISGGTNWIQIATGYQQSAGIKSDGTLWLWGRNSEGQLGNGANIDVSSPIQTISSGTNWKQIYLCDPSAIGSYAIGVKSDGTLWTWGTNNYGQLGDGTNTSRSSPVQTIAGGTNWDWSTNRRSSAGRFTAYAIKTDGTLWAWGNGSGGALGDNTGISKNSPVQTISGGNNWRQVAGGNYNASAIKTDGRLWSWGNNGYGQLGDNTTISRSSPVQTSSAGTNWKDVQKDNSRGNTTAIKTDNTLWTWGLGSFSLIGDGAQITRTTPTPVGSNEASGTTANGVGTDWNKCIRLGSFMNGAIKINGSLYLWGTQDNQGQMTQILVNVTTNITIPAAWPAVASNWLQVSMANQGQHMAAIKTDGTLWTWGRNNEGQLGDNSITSKSIPVQTVSGGTDWLQVAAGNINTAAIKLNGTLWTWGSNTDGALGNNGTANTSSPVQTISGGTNWKFVSMGANFSAGIKTDGTLWTWGKNTQGQLGNNTIINRSSPIQTIAGGNNWKSISVGEYIMQGIYFYDAYNLYPS